MRAFNRIKARGFTLVELMIVVAIIGVLAALAIFGVRKYLAAAKSSEAMNTIGAMNRLAVAAYERENAPNELAVGTSQGSSHALCVSAAAAVPASPPAAKKYTANPADGTDFNTGNQTVGYKCLKFTMNEPQYYAYIYQTGDATFAKPATFIAGDWANQAEGDLDGDGKVFSKFAVGGKIINGVPITSTQIAIENETDLAHRRWNPRARRRPGVCVRARSSTVHARSVGGGRSGVGPVVGEGTSARHVRLWRGGRSHRRQAVDHWSTQAHTYPMS
jgi:type IV pilus assembly protein PilA